MTRRLPAPIALHGSWRVRLIDFYSWRRIRYHAQKDTVKLSILFPSKYVKAGDLNGKPVTLTIKGLKVEELGHGAEKENKPVLYFEKATKGLVLNRTNAMIIGALYGDETDDWHGKRITIYATKVRAFGSTQDAIRVREEIPAQSKPVAQAAHVVEPTPMDDDEDVVDCGDGDALFDPASEAA